jgi:hypothetical protein
MKYVLTKDLIIPAGTELSRVPLEIRNGQGYVCAPVAFGKDFTGDLVVQVHSDAISSGYFEEVPITTKGKRK